MKYIISGYKGIMDLDLTHIDPKYHAEMIALHKKDIKEYKKEQSKLQEDTDWRNEFKLD